MPLSLSNRTNRRLPFPSTEPAASFEGIHRYRYEINGRPAWYATNAAGEVVGFRLVQLGEDEAEVAASLVESLRGKAAPRLTIIPRSASAPQLSSLVAAALCAPRRP